MTEFEWLCAWMGACVCVHVGGEDGAITSILTVMTKKTTKRALHRIATLLPRTPMKGPNYRYGNCCFFLSFYSFNFIVKEEAGRQTQK